MNNHMNPVLRDIVEEELHILTQWCKRQRVPLYMEDEVTSDIYSGTENIFISFGGDGTLIRAATAAAASDNSCYCYVLGINYGTLGFLASEYKYTQTRITDLLSVIATGQENYQHRHYLNVKVGDTPYIAINDVFITNTLSKIATCEINLRKFTDVIEPITQVRSDGVLICSATGSTAYNLAAGGAVMYPSAKTLQLNCVAPHGLMFRPTIFDEHSELIVDMIPKEGRQYPKLVIDGNEIDIDTNSPLRVSVSINKQPLGYIHIPELCKDSNFFETLRSKFS